MEYDNDFCKSFSWVILFFGKCTTATNSRITLDSNAFLITSAFFYISCTNSDLEQPNKLFISRNHNIRHIISRIC